MAGDDAARAGGPAVSLSHVDAGYPGHTVLHDVSFDVARGEIFVLLGGSGCGKSTVMKHMIGLNPVLAGRLSVAGMEWSPKTKAALCRKIGVMFQSGALFGSMTCLQNVMLPLEAFTTLYSVSARQKARHSSWSPTNCLQSSRSPTAPPCSTRRAAAWSPLARRSN